MFSIPKKKKPNRYRNSEHSIKQKPFPQSEYIKKLKHNISKDQNNLTRKWNFTSKTFLCFRTVSQSHHQFPSRHSQMRSSNKYLHVERKTVHRTLKNQQNFTYYFYIKNQGNNSDRVAQMLTARKNWIKSSSKNYSNQINFHWGALSKDSCNKKNMPFCSRISGSYELTDKARLYNNIVNYCSKNKISNEKFLPVTYCFTSRQSKSQIEQNVREFFDYFSYIESHTSLTNSWIIKPTNLNCGRDIFLFNSLDKLLSLLYLGKSVNHNSEIQSSFNNLVSNKNPNQPYKNDKPSSKLIQELQQKIKFNRNSFSRFNNYISTKKTLPMASICSENQIRTKYSFHQSTNTVQSDKKITASHVFRTRQKSLKLKTQAINNFQHTNNQLKKYSNPRLKPRNIQSFQTKSEFQKSQIEEKLCELITNFVQSKTNYGQKSLKRQIVIQKYIENPFLIHGNKFDIRIWVLVDQEFNFYIFKSGYLRFSSEKYKLDKNSIQNNFIHLTNHAVQKFSDKYQKETNIVKMSFLKEYLRDKQNLANSIVKSADQKYEQMQREMQRIIAISLQASLGSFYRQQHNRQKYDWSSQFQLFGYDFLLDRELNVRLIEANCNPSITEDNIYLGQAVPRMLDDLFKLTVDRVYLPRQQTGQKFEMDGFGVQNMWKKLGKIGQLDLTSVRNSFQ